MTHDDAVAEEAADLAEAEDVAELLRTHHPEAKRDPYGHVLAPGFLCSPGAPGRRQVRVQHRTRFPGAVSGLSFADAAAEEFVLVAVYADLLRAHGWSVRDVRHTRPALLVHRASPAPQIGT